MLRAPNVLLISSSGVSMSLVIPDISVLGMTRVMFKTEMSGDKRDIFNAKKKRKTVELFQQTRDVSGKTEKFN